MIEHYIPLLIILVVIVFVGLVALVLWKFARWIWEALSWPLRYLPVRKKPNYLNCGITKTYDLSKEQASDAIRGFFCTTHVLASDAPYVLNHSWWKLDPERTTSDCLIVAIEYTEDINRYVSNSAHQHITRMATRYGGGPPSQFVNVNTPRAFVQYFQISLEIKPSQSYITRQDTSESIAQAEGATVRYLWTVDNKLNHRSPLASEIVEYTIKALEQDRLGIHLIG